MREELVPLARAAQELGFSYWAVLSWARQGRLGARRLPNGQWRLSRQALEEFKSGTMTVALREERASCKV